LIGRQLGDNFGDFFDFHVAQYSTTGRVNLSPPDIAHRPDGYTGSDESRLALHGASSGGAAMIASKSDHICVIGGGGLDYPMNCHVLCVEFGSALLVCLQRNRSR
jgi:hypothetical protein